MALTETEKNELKQDILNQIKSESQSCDELETVSTLDGVTSLPALRGTDVVSAPIALLRKPAEDAPPRPMPPPRTRPPQRTLRTMRPVPPTVPQ